MTRSDLTTDDLTGRNEPQQPVEDSRHEATHPDSGAMPAGSTAQTQQPPQAQAETEQPAPLLDDREAGVFLDRWREVQGRFVDDPQGAVRDGDSLVAELMQALAQRFADQKGGLQEQWDRGGEPETEQLRRALQGYRSFFHRLLSA
jgi:hypothetical protein